MKVLSLFGSCVVVCIINDEFVVVGIINDEFVVADNGLLLPSSVPSSDDDIVVVVDIVIDVEDKDGVVGFVIIGVIFDDGFVTGISVCEMFLPRGMFPA